MSWGPPFRIFWWVNTILWKLTTTCVVILWSPEKFSIWDVIFLIFVHFEHWTCERSFFVSRNWPVTLLSGICILSLDALHRLSLTAGSETALDLGMRLDRPVLVQIWGHGLVRSLYQSWSYTSDSTLVPVWRWTKEILRRQTWLLPIFVQRGLVDPNSASDPADLDLVICLILNTLWGDCVVSFDLLNVSLVWLE